MSVIDDPETSVIITEANPIRSVISPPQHSVVSRSFSITYRHALLTNGAKRGKLVVDLLARRPRDYRPPDVLITHRSGPEVLDR